MKPIKLIMSAFGPFADVVTVDFKEQFGDRGLFLICGDTGAGKTTIFDGISYALFGETSGIYRAEKSIRSDFAAPETETYVRLEFEQEGKVYSVFRYPAQEVKKKRGQGTTEKSAEAELFRPGKETITGARKVTEQIEELLHIDHAQFKQICMIAQGEFRELLASDSAERSRILRKIFMTDGYDQMSVVAKRRLADAKKNVESYEQAVNHYFTGISVSQDSGYAGVVRELAEIAAADGKAPDTGKMTEVLQAVISEDRAVEDSLEKEIEVIDRETEEWNRRAAVARQNNQILRTLEQEREEKRKLEGRKPDMDRKAADVITMKKAVRYAAPAFLAANAGAAAYQKAVKEALDGERQLKQAKDRVERAGAVYETALRNKSQAEALIRTATLMKQEEPNYQKRDSALKEKRQTAERMARLEARQNTVKAELETVLTCRTETERFIEAHREDEVKLSEAEHRAKAISALLAQMDEIFNVRIRELHGREVAYENAMQAYGKAVNAWEEAKRIQEQAEAAYDRSRFGIAASELREGMPCPICGSVHHPKKALLPADSATAEEVDEARKAVENTLAGKDRTGRESVSRKEAYESYLDHVKKDILNILDDCTVYQVYTGSLAEEALIDSFTNAYGEMRTVQAGHLKQLESLRQSVKEYRDAEQRAAEVRQKTDELNQGLQDLEKEIGECRNAVVAAETVLDQIGTLKYPDFRTAERERTGFERKAEELMNAIVKSEADRNQAVRDQAAAQSALNLMNQMKEEKEAESRKAQKEFETVLRENGFESQSAFEEKNLGEAVIKAAEEEIDTYHLSVRINESRLNDLQRQAVGKVLADEEELERKARDSRISGDRKKNARADANNRIQTNTRVLKEIHRQEELLKDRKAKRDLLYKLDKVISGQFSGRKGVTFEQFIQISGFKRIIHAANRHLYDMSDHQYTLHVHGDSPSADEKNILSLDVLDDFTGKVREARSLSGGESFKASLCLALGLSDSITGSSGISTDTLFIDEGFGSLDEDSLAAAINLLLSMAGSDKLIGIISHVHELKEQIDKQIVVERAKKGKGSSISYVLKG